MNRSQNSRLSGGTLAGLAAGVVNGLFGGGGGMLLIPGLRRFARVEEAQLFPLSVSVMLPVCLLSIGMTAAAAPLPWAEATPYLIGSTAGGICVGFLGKKIPVVWLHRILGLTLIWGGIRSLW